MQMPHPLNRPYQQETYDKIISSPKKYVIVRAPTGSGKSAWAAQSACDGNKTIVLTRTKSLQSQYEEGYSFTPLYGKGNYECLGYGQTIDMFSSQQMADMCDVPEKLRQDCYSNCPYYLQKWEFLASIGGSLNYSKFLLDKLTVGDFKPSILFLDEAHELSDLVVNYSGIEFSLKTKNIQEFTDYPMFHGLKNVPQTIMRGWAVDWLQEFYDSLNNNKPSRQDKIFYKWWQRRREAVEITLAALTISPECWFVYCDKDKFLCRPLTSKFHFERFFDEADKLILMSATINHNDVKSLGITDYEFIDVPNVWPAETRPIEDLHGPKLNYRSTQEDWNKHADAIANRINQCPDEWTGLIHSPSKWLTWDLANRMRRLTDRPIYTPDENDGTEEVMSKWLSVRDNGTIGIFWQLWEGIDSGKDGFSIVAKVPFINFAEPFDEARFHYDRTGAQQRVANKVVQAWGRVRRGRDSDYEPGAKMVAIADSQWTRLKNYISRDVMEAIK